MGFREMGLVGDRSRATKSDLLLLLKIADGCDDEGRNSFIETPAMGRWLRCSERGTQYVLQRLQTNREIEIEINETGREIVLRGGRRFRPKWFIHVRCVSEWEAYQAEAESADCADFSVGLLRGRPKRKYADIADSVPQRIRKFRQKNPQEIADQSATFRSAYKEGSSSERVVEQEAASVEPITDAQCEALRGLWNERTTWPLKPIDELNPKRRKLIAYALTERPVDQWAFVFERVEHSTFLRGGGKQGFVARFEWVLDWTHAVQILEGQYDDHFSAAELRAAAAQLSAATCGRCPHTPECHVLDECIRKFALKLRARAEKAS